MKKVILLVSLVLFCTVGVAEVEQKPTYSYTVTIKYNSLSLSEIAIVDAKLRAVCEDACKLETQIKETQYQLEDGGMVFIAPDQSTDVRY